MSLKHRLERLESIEQSDFPLGETHLHEVYDGLDNTRETCEKCRAMTEEEYQAWLSGAYSKPGRIKTIEVNLTRKEESSAFEIRK